MKLSVARVEVLIWVLIYGGLLVLAVGLALRDVHGLLAGTVSLIGGVVAAVGVVLIWILIYGGLLVLAFGLALRGVHTALAGVTVLGGALAVAIGIVLIWVRARRARAVR